MGDVQHSVSIARICNRFETGIQAWLVHQYVPCRTSFGKRTPLLLQLRGGLLCAAGDVVAGLDIFFFGLTCALVALLLFRFW